MNKKIKILLLTTSAAALSLATYIMFPYYVRGAVIIGVLMSYAVNLIIEIIND